jgi:exopolysaccharide biosynthesis polyprenyl glycosylphosphotransferase
VFAVIQGALLTGILAASMAASSVGPLAGGAAVLPMMLLAFQVCLYLNRAHERLSDSDGKGLASASRAALLEGSALVLGACMLLPELWPTAPLGLGAGVLSILALAVVQPLVPALVDRRCLVEGVLILGGGEVARKLHQELAFGTASVFKTNGHARKSNEVKDPAVSLGLRHLREWAQQEGFTRIVVADPPISNATELAASLIECKAGGMDVEQAVDSYGRLQSKLWLDGVRPEWLVYAPWFRASRFYLLCKRAADVVGAVALLLLASPLLALIALAIRLESPGPALFWQERVGLNARRFLMAKFRSMRVDAERETGPTWCQERDPRITRVGRLLRKFRLDELPQILNVLKGEMSFIGPRPERPSFVELLSRQIPYYPMRHSVKPGISGWAQVMYPYGASLADAHEKLQFDLYYLQNLSLAFELRILLRTFKVVLAGKGR